MKADEAISILKTWRITGDKAHEALDMAIEALAKDINVPINDCISRQGAIDALIEGFKRTPTIAIRAKDMIEQLPSAQPEHSQNTPQKQPNPNTLGIKTEETCEDVISRQAAIDALDDEIIITGVDNAKAVQQYIHRVSMKLHDLPSAKPTLYGYNVEHLMLIASVLQKENLPPERIIEALTDIGRVVTIVADEFVDNLRKAFENAGFDKQGGR